MASSKQMKMTDYLPKPKTPVYNSIVENYYLTSPGFRMARWETKIVEHAPWSFIGEVAAVGENPSSGIDSYQNERIAELLKKKFDARKVDEAIAEGMSIMKPFGPGSSPRSQMYNVYKALVYAERLLVNPGFKPDTSYEKDGLRESPPIPVTLTDKHLAGIYTQADTDNLERIKTRELQDTMVESHGLTGLFGGIHRRKTKKSKRAQKKRKSTRKSKLTRSR